MSATRERPWRLGQRLARVFLCSTLGFVLAIALLAVLAIGRQIGHAIDRLAEEEVEEMRSALVARPFTLQRFEQAAELLAARHREVPMAWRAFAPDGALLIESGPAELVAAARRPRAPDERRRLGRATRLATLALEDGTGITLVLDGAREYDALWGFVRWTGAAVLASALGALLVARWFSRRVSSLLAAVAAQARSARHASDEAIAMRGAPLEIRDVVEALHELLARIRRESDEQRVYLAGLAHELRAPLQNLLGEAEVALRQPRGVEEYRAVLASQLDELRELGDAVDNFVAISRGGESARAGAEEAFDLGEEARIRLVRERATAEREGVGLALDVRGETRMAGDREALLRALRNLVRNAIQWSPRGARVDVRIAGRDGELEIVVDDAGPGVPEELRDAIFEPFVRGPALQGRRIGYGLGLAIVKRAAQAQGGTVVVERSPGGGARFRLLVPRRVAEGSERGGAEHPHVARPHRRAQELA